jgi:hypothetical protein
MRSVFALQVPEATSNSYWQPGSLIRETDGSLPSFAPVHSPANATFYESTEQAVSAMHSRFTPVYFDIVCFQFSGVVNGP